MVPYLLLPAETMRAARERGLEPSVAVGKSGARQSNSNNEKRTTETTHVELSCQTHAQIEKQ